MNLSNSQNQVKQKWASLAKVDCPASLLLSAASCWWEEKRASPSGLARETSSSSCGGPVVPSNLASFPSTPILPPGWILGMPHCSSLHMINKIQELSWRPSEPAVVPKWLHGLLFSARCLISPLSFRCSPRRCPETDRSLISTGYVSSHQGLTPLASVSFSSTESGYLWLSYDIVKLT